MFLITIWLHLIFTNRIFIRVFIAFTHRILSPGRGRLQSPPHRSQWSELRHQQGRGGAGHDQGRDLAGHHRCRAWLGRGRLGRRLHDQEEIVACGGDVSGFRTAHGVAPGDRRESPARPAWRIRSASRLVPECPSPAWTHFRSDSSARQPHRVHQGLTPVCRPGTQPRIDWIRARPR